LEFLYKRISYLKLYLIVLGHQLNKKRILIFSFYFPPDLCAGSFRMDALAKQLARYQDVTFDLITNEPNRYQNHIISESYATYPNIKVHKAPQKPHSGGLLSQTLLFYRYAKFALAFVWRNRKQPYQLVYATSSRLFTALLASIVALFLRVDLYLDIRDLFVDTIREVIGGIRGWILFLLFSPLQWFCFSRAKVINIVSAGFKPYIEKYRPQKLTIFTNGIDTLFYDNKWSVKQQQSQPLTIMYAGNIGAGQGLDLIVPPLAKHFNDRVQFVFIGSGSTLPKLQALTKGLSNVVFRNPVSREKMLEQLQNADVLFLTLNDLPSLYKVLPSKLFEYAAIPKPILAGLVGYAKEFATKNVDDCFIFDSLDLTTATKHIDYLIENHHKIATSRENFMQKYNRDSIMEQFAKSIVTETYKNNR